MINDHKCRRSVNIRDALALSHDNDTELLLADNAAIIIVAHSSDDIQQSSYLILFRCKVVDKAAPKFFHPLFPRDVSVASGVLQGRVVSAED